MNLRVISESATEPVSLAEVKANLQQALTDDDADISGMITAARNLAEAVNGREMVPKQYELGLDHFPGTLPAGMTSISSPYFGFWPSDAYLLYNGTRPVRSAIYLPAPLMSVQSISCKDLLGNTTTLVENTQYAVDGMKEPGIVLPMWNYAWPTADLWPSSPIRIRFSCGYGVYQGMVSTNGTAITRLSGDYFSPMFDGRAITVNSAAYSFAYVDTSHGILSASAGVQASVAFTVPYLAPQTIRRGIIRLVSQWYEKKLPFDAIRFIAEIPFDVRALFQADMIPKF